jgi:hypothetical protein
MTMIADAVCKSGLRIPAHHRTNRDATTIAPAVVRITA